MGKGKETHYSASGSGCSKIQYPFQGSDFGDRGALIMGKVVITGDVGWLNRITIFKDGSFAVEDQLPPGNWNPPIWSCTNLKVRVIGELKGTPTMSCQTNPYVAANGGGDYLDVAADDCAVVTMDDIKPTGFDSNGRNSHSVILHYPG
jgi:hypothetical protein